MKTIKNILPFIILLFPQVIFENYTYILVSTITIGFICGRVLDDKNVFLKALIFQFIFFTMLFYITNKNIFYLNNIAENLGLSTLLIPVVFVLFNSLNISILFLFGYKLNKLIFSNVNLVS